MFTKRKKHLVKTLSCATRRLLHFCEKELGLHRIQAPIPISKKIEIRFAEFFGFVREGILFSFDPENKEDCVMMGRVKCQPQQ